MMAWNKDLYQSKAVTVALQLASQKLAELPDTPSILEVARDPEQQAALKLIVSRQMMARPYVAPPGIPPERLKALRSAFDATMRDPELLAEAAKLQADIAPTKGEDVQDIVARIYATPRPVIDRVKKYFAP